jgi:hypothetical protein
MRGDERLHQTITVMGTQRRARLESWFDVIGRLVFSSTQ